MVTLVSLYCVFLLKGTEPIKNVKWVSNMGTKRYDRWDSLVISGSYNVIAFFLTSKQILVQKGSVASGNCHFSLHLSLVIGITYLGFLWTVGPLEFCVHGHREGQMWMELQKTVDMHVACISPARAMLHFPVNFTCKTQAQRKNY